MILQRLALCCHFTDIGKYGISDLYICYQIISRTPGDFVPVPAVEKEVYGRYTIITGLIQGFACYLGADKFLVFDNKPCT